MIVLMLTMCVGGRGYNTGYQIETDVLGEILQSLKGPTVGVVIGIWRLGGGVRAFTGYVEHNESAFPRMHYEYVLSMASRCPFRLSGASASKQLWKYGLAIPKFIYVVLFKLNKIKLVSANMGTGCFSRPFSWHHICMPSGTYFSPHLWNSDMINAYALI